jgi:urease subunit alpha
MLGGGTGPAHGTLATTCTPGPWHIGRMIQAADAFPMNIGLRARATPRQPAALEEMILGGACALKLHEDWGTTPAAIDNCLSVADQYDVQVMIHTDTLNESGFVEITIDAIKGRTIHAFHTEGRRRRPRARHHQGLRAANVLPSSTNPTRPYTVNTIDEHLDMLMVCHHLDSRDPRGHRLCREPHPQGDHRGGRHPARHGRVLDHRVRQPGHGPRRRGDHPHLADRRQDEAPARRLPEETGDNDNLRVRRYIAKYTINPAIAHGCRSTSARSRSASAPICCWEPGLLRRQARHGAARRHDRRRAHGRSQRLDPDAAAGAYRPMFGAYGKARTNLR